MALCKSWGYVKLHQEGSHIILQTEQPFPQRISVPNHNPLRLGTLNSILRSNRESQRREQGQYS